jgi:hypothetical protein
VGSFTVNPLTVLCKAVNTSVTPVDTAISNKFPGPYVPTFCFIIIQSDGVGTLVFLEISVSCMLFVSQIHILSHRRVAGGFLLFFFYLRYGGFKAVTS